VKIPDLGVSLVTPTLDALPGYQDALQRGWSPDNVSPERTALLHLARIAEDPAGFVAALTDPEAKGGPIKMPDGSTRPRLPGYFLWAWDGTFCGSFSFRWQNGTSALPDYCLGHIGYSIVSWKQRRGYATAGLRLLLDQARQHDLDYVELTTEPGNLASQKVILANGGRQVGQRRKIAAYGGAEELLFRIDL
jgi:predicted acetyltransferase